MQRLFIAAATIALCAACRGNAEDDARAHTESADRPAEPAAAEAGLAPLPRTTDGAIAVGNLDAVISGQERRVASAPGDATLRAGLVELLLTRGQFLGSIADYERASALAEALVTEAPNRFESWKARASVDATWHRFDAALTDLEAAERAGAPATSLRGTRSSILAARGRLDDAFAMAPSDGDLAGESLALAGRGLLEGELGRLAAAEGDLAAARARYRDVSPLPLAWMDALQAALWEKQGDRVKARAYYTRAVRILPQYAKAAAHLAAYETPERAVAVLTRVALRSDDPEVIAELGDALRRVGRIDESRDAVGRARARYEALVSEHPEAFADHAARFWLGIGGDAARALPLAARNAELRPTDETCSLWLEAARAARDDRAACEAARRLVALPHAADALRAPARHVAEGCVVAGGE